MTPNQIRALRKSLRLTPERFAAKLGFTGPNSRVTIHRWETGKRKPTPQTIILMKQLIGK